VNPVVKKFWALGLALSALVAPVGCYGTDGEDPGEAQDPLDDAPEEPGTCRKLCCTSSDCPAGQSCQAFDSAWGTLGACLAVEPGWGETTVGCWTYDEPECDPLTNSGCDANAGEACDLFIGDSDPTVMCFLGDNVGLEGEACDNAYGPQCAPGYHCLADTAEDGE
jgi:hypothetical protein